LQRDYVAKKDRLWDLGWKAKMLSKRLWFYNKVSYIIRWKLIKLYNRKTWS
jgi:hypothetical protein